MFRVHADPGGRSSRAVRFVESHQWRPKRWRISLRYAGSLIGLWLGRSQTRRVLSELDEHQLLDIGLTRAEARRESAQPFWKPYRRRHGSEIMPCDRSMGFWPEA